MFVRLFRISRWLHRNLGLWLCLYLVLEALTGILLNHPQQLEAFSVSAFWLPPSYRVSNWNRGVLRTVVFSRQTPTLAFLCGTEGVWRTTDGGRSFEEMNDGLPRSREFRRTNHLLLIESARGSFLFAGTKGGLYVCSPAQGKWHRLSLGNAVHSDADASPEKREEVVKLFLVDNELIVVTDSRVFRAVWTGSPADLTFRPVRLLRSAADLEKTIPAVELLLAMHSGELWRLPGRLLVDFGALALLFLSLTGFYIWYVPYRNRRLSQKRLSQEESARSRSGTTAVFRWLYKYHINVGVWVTVWLLVVAGTACFLPPSPLVLLAVRTHVPKRWWPGPLPENPWEHKISNAAYDPAQHELWLAVDGTFWRGKADFSQPFVKQDLRLPLIGGMGITVLECLPNGRLLVGSASGLFESGSEGQPGVDLLNGRRPVSADELRRPTRTNFVAGYFETPDGQRFVATHADGLKRLDGQPRPAGFFSMPRQLALQYRLPLWKVLFEIHNCRILRDWLGIGSALLPLLGAFGLLLVIVTGFYDWAYQKNLLPRN